MGALTFTSWPRPEDQSPSGKVMTPRDIRRTRTTVRSKPKAPAASAECMLELWYGQWKTQTTCIRNRYTYHTTHSLRSRLFYIRGGISISTVHTVDHKEALVAARVFSRPCLVGESRLAVAFGLRNSSTYSGILQPCSRQHDPLLFA